MAITTNWSTLTFSVPKADLTLVSGTLFDMNTETDFRQKINGIMDDEDGIVFDTPIRHNTEVTVAGTTFARTIEMINGYSLTFTPDSQSTVRYSASNNNLFDVANGILNQNQVQVISTNSGGLISVSSGSGLDATQDTRLKELHEEKGLSSGNPMTVTPTTRGSGAWTQTVSGDGESTTTVTRD